MNERNVLTDEARFLLILEAVTETIDELSRAGDEWADALTKLRRLRFALLGELAEAAPSLGG